MQGTSTPSRARPEHGAAWLSDARACRGMPGMCRAVLPLLSSGLDVLGAAGQAGAGQIHTGCGMEAGT